MIKGKGDYIKPLDKKALKDEMKAKRRQIEQKGLKEIKQEFNNGYDLDELSIDKVIKDRSLIKRKSRKRGIDHLVERRCPNGRLTARFMLI